MRLLTDIREGDKKCSLNMEIFVILLFNNCGYRYERQYGLLVLEYFRFSSCYICVLSTVRVLMGNCCHHSPSPIHDSFPGIGIFDSYPERRTVLNCTSFETSSLLIRSFSIYSIRLRTRKPRRLRTCGLFAALRCASARGTEVGWRVASVT